MEERIKYYDESSLSINYNIDLINNYLKSLDTSKNYCYDINNILEFFNIIQYTKVKDSSIKRNYSKKIDFLYIQINDFIKKFSEDNFLDLFNEVYIEYIEDFWKLVDLNINELNFSQDFLTKILKSRKINIIEILKCKNLSKTYQNSLKNHLLKCHNLAEILIDEYATIKNNNHKTLYLPKFNEKEYDFIFNKYVKSKKANLNYLQAIPNISRNEILISDKIKLLATKKAKDEENKILNKNSFRFGSNVVFGDFEEPKSYEIKNHDVIFKYDTKWIKDNLDKPTLLNNFIYLFEFVDKQMRFSNISKKYEFGVFESLLGLRLKDEYPSGITFKIKEMTMIMQMMQYQNELKNNKTSIESCVEWFYSNYLENEFNIKNFLVNIQSETNNYFEKCRLIFPEIDGILKQFSIFQENKKIDRELLEISSSPILFEKINSLLKKKYIYEKNENLIKLNNLLFSNQSMLHYINGYDKYDSFFNLIRSENIPYSSFQKYNRPNIDWLIKTGYIKKDKKGIIKFKDIDKISILFDLYENEVINYYHYPPKFRKILDKLVREKICYFESTLFTKSEAKYLNYYLNNRNVSNGHFIRNRYSHGTQPKKENDDIHYQNYLILLYIIILITIKINDDLCLYEDNKK